jgi:hypothetical protein
MRCVDTARERVEIATNIKKRGSSNIEALTLAKNDSERVSEESVICSSPVCEVKFEQTGVVRLEPRKYCDKDCRMDAWAIRRVRKLLENETDQRAIEILRGKP